MKDLRGLIAAGILIFHPAFGEETGSRPETGVIAENLDIHFSDKPIPPPQAESKEDSDLSQQEPGVASDEGGPDLAMVQEMGGVDAEPGQNFSIFYYGMFLGPSIKNPSAYQPLPTGEASKDFPVITKNYLGLSYEVAEDMGVTPTLYWLWRPVLGQKLTLQDPFLRFSYANIINTEHFNLYADLRAHIGVSSLSRENEMRLGVQNFQALSYMPDEDGSLILSLYGSWRYNFFGKHGNGNDLELYLAPHLSYRFMPNLAFTLLYEMQVVHLFGNRAFSMENDGTDLEPGLLWDVTPSLTINPYLNFYPNDKFSLKTSSFGMTLSWNIF